LFINRFITVGH